MPARSKLPGVSVPAPVAVALAVAVPELAQGVAKLPKVSKAAAAAAAVAAPIEMPMGVTPAYWDEACKHLSKRDRVMRKLIPQCGEVRLQSRGDAFTTLARSIVGQQISVKAAQSVW